MLDSDIEESIVRYIEHIRRMALLTDDQITMLLRQVATENPGAFDVLKDAAQKKSLHDAMKDMKQAAKDIRGDARKFARKVDRL